MILHCSFKTKSYCQMLRDYGSLKAMWKWYLSSFPVCTSVHTCVCWYLTLWVHVCNLHLTTYFFDLYPSQLQRHFQADTIPRIERMRQKEQGLQRRLLRVGHSFNFTFEFDSIAPETRLAFAPCSVITCKTLIRFGRCSPQSAWMISS